MNGSDSTIATYYGNTSRACVDISDYKDAVDPAPMRSLSCSLGITFSWTWVGQNSHFSSLGVLSRNPSVNLIVTDANGADCEEITAGSDANDYTLTIT